MNFKYKALSIIITIMAIAIVTTVASADNVNTLRLYGEGGLSAAFPYTDPAAPFDPRSDEAPEKDFVVFNPAYIPINVGIVVNNTDSIEKVFARQWFVPELVEPVGDVWLENPNHYVSEDVVTEYTYMFLDKHDNPTCGTAKSPTGSYWTKFWMPVADNDDNQIGIDGCDINGDGSDDLIMLKDVGNYSGLNNAIPDGRKDINISSMEFEVEIGDELTFLDHKILINNIVAPSSIGLEIFYIGRDEPVSLGEISMSNPDEDYLRAGRHSKNVGRPTFEEPWYLHRVNIVQDKAYLEVGRLLHTGETFFVDAAEYDIPMIYGPTDDTVKYITIRNPVPEHADVDLEDLSVVKKCVMDNENLPLLPPFNRIHDMIDDISIPDDLTSRCTAINQDNIGSSDDDQDSGFGGIDHLMNNYDTVQERRIENIPPLEIYFTGKANETRFDTNLLELLNETGVESWDWLDIYTMPRWFKNFVYPTLPDIDDGTGDFLVVSSWKANNSCDQRVMFAYDQETGEQDIYINNYATYNALRLYGEDESYDAAFPYTDPEAPFDPRSIEAPGKDFVTFNPAIMDLSIGITVNQIDSMEKVFARQWFIPEYVEPVGNVWLDPVNHYVSEDVITEYTYMFIDKHYNPINGISDKTHIWMPIADNDNNQIGMDGCDIDGDGDDELVELMDVGDYPGLHDAAPDGRKDINISSLDEFTLVVGDELTFLDHKIVLTNTKSVELAVDVYYIGNDEPEYLQTVSISEDDETYIRAGRHFAEVELPSFEKPWYLHARDTFGGTAYVKVGRLLHTGETFFVDGAEYDISMIYGPEVNDDEFTTFKYITIRNPVPEHDDVDLEDLSVIKECVEDGEVIPLLPPFNRVHAMVDDISIPDDMTSRCTAYFPDNIGAGDDDSVSGFGEEDHLRNIYDTVEERIIPDIPALEIYFTGKANETRFDTNLLEILNETGDVESWDWLDIYTMPRWYKEFVYPTLPDIDGGEGDWLVTSSFKANNSCDERVMFAYDAADGTGLYMNQGDDADICGDVNGDSAVNMLDVTKLFDHVTFGDPIDSTWAADVNCDSGVNMLDVTKLFDHVTSGASLDCC